MSISYGLLPNPHLHVSALYYIFISSYFTMFPTLISIQIFTRKHRVNLLKFSKVPADGLLNTLSYCWYSKYLIEAFHFIVEQ